MSLVMVARAVEDGACLNRTVSVCEVVELLNGVVVWYNVRVQYMCLSLVAPGVPATAPQTSYSDPANDNDCDSEAELLEGIYRGRVAAEGVVMVDSTRVLGGQSETLHWGTML